MVSTSISNVISKVRNTLQHYVLLKGYRSDGHISTRANLNVKTTFYSIIDNTTVAFI